MNQISNDVSVTAIRPFQVTHRLVLSIAVPMTLAYVTTPLLGLTDTAVAGRLGDPALLGGLAAGALVFDVVFASFNFLRSATTGLTAQAHGKGTDSEERAIFWRAMTIALVAGLALMLCGPAISALGVRFIDPAADVADAMRVYIAIRILAAPFTLANYAILGHVLGRGEGWLGLALQLLLNGANIALSVYLGLWKGWGLEGVAWATFASEGLAFAVGMALIAIRFSGRERLAPGRIFERAAMMRILAVSGDIMIRSFALLTAFAFMARSGATLGTLTLAANAILMNFFLVSGYFLDGFATAAEQLAGRALGAQYRPAFRRAVLLSVAWGFGLALIAFAFFLALGDGIIAFLTTHRDVRALAVEYLPWAAWTPVTGVLAFAMDGVFIGATWTRDMRNMMLASLAVFLAALFALPQHYGNSGLWMALHIFLLFRGFSLAAMLMRREPQAFPV